MMNPKVKVVSIKGKYLVLRWQDPMTGAACQRSAGTMDRKAAQQKALELEQAIRNGSTTDHSRTTWKELRAQFEAHHLPSLKLSTVRSYATAMNSFEATIRPHRLADISEMRMATYQSRLRDEKLSEASIASYLRHLKAILRWGVDHGIMGKCPKIKMPKRARGTKHMKGRPINSEEFRRMLDSVEFIVGEENAHSWKRYLEGLWCSGLRLEESLEVYWDRPDRLYIDLAGELPLLKISAEYEKGNRDRTLPIAPEFENWILQTPESERHGAVFDPLGYHGDRPRKDWVSKVVSRIGEKANVVVDIDSRTQKPKYASAHDLRRSFGARWAFKINELQLMELMRHESINTTLRYYVGQDATRLGKHLREVVKGDDQHCVW